jgi:predicted ester cyclase
VEAAEVAHRFVELWYAPEREDELRTLLAEGYVHHSVFQDFDAEGFVTQLGAVNASLTDVDYRVDHTVVDGDRVAVYVSVTATHSGNFFDIAATGKRVSTVGACFLRVAGDQVAEDWDAWALQSILFQLRQP